MSKSKPQPRPKSGGRYYMVDGKLVPEAEHQAHRANAPAKGPETAPKRGDN